MSSALEEGDEPVDFLPDQHRLGNRQLLGTLLVGKLVRTQHRRLQAEGESVKPKAGIVKLKVEN